MEEREGTPPATASMVVLGCNVVAYAAILFVTLASRRKILLMIDPPKLAELPAPAEIFLTTHAAIYSAVFLLVVTGLLVKEVAIERKEATLWLNILFLVIAFAVGALYWVTVRLPLMKIKLGAG